MRVFDCTEREQAYGIFVHVHEANDETRASLDTTRAWPSQKTLLATHKESRVPCFDSRSTQGYNGRRGNKAFLPERKRGQVRQDDL